MRVGLNLLSVTPGGGGATRYAAELVPMLTKVASDVQLTIFVGADAPDEIVEDPRSAAVEWVRLPVCAANRTHLLAQMAALPLLGRRRRIDVLHSVANIGPLVSPGAARVVTLLDVIWLHQGAVALTAGGNEWQHGSAARAFMFLSKACARNADRVITISESARDDIVGSLGLAPEKVDVTPLGVRVDNFVSHMSEQNVRWELDLGDALVVLCVAQKRPYKNLGSLIRATAELRDEHFVLVLPGSPTPHEQELRHLAAQLGVSERVRFPAWVSEATLEGLYRVASCFVFPSLMEGFGLPVLEAMARNVPVACSNRPALPEVAGDAAILFDPEDQKQVTDAVRRLLGDRELAQTLVARGAQRVRIFSWERTAEATLAAYRRAAAQKGLR